MKLNRAQYEAVYHRAGPLLVLAGAGSGKTRVITERIAALLAEGVPPEEITALTFTNKAAAEMQERIAARAGSKAEGLFIGTFHALGLAILRRNPETAGRSQRLSVFGTQEQRAVLRSVLAELKLPSEREDIERWQGLVSAVKNGSACADARIEEVRLRYDALLRSMNAVDFDDLILLAIHVLRGNDAARSHWQARCQHLLIDEYQDTNRLQYELMRALAPDPQALLCAVGDDDQAIYGWRGAEVRNLFRLQEDYPGLHLVRLEQNYRSTQAILNAANRLIAHNPERLGKTLKSAFGAGKPVRIWQCKDTEEEAERVAADLKARHAVDGLCWHQVAVLARTGYQLRAMERALRAAAIPYHLIGARSFFERSEIQDALAYLRLLANPDDNMAFLRAITRPRRGIGEQTLAQLSRIAHERGCSLMELCWREEVLAGLRARDTLSAFGQLMAELDDAFKRLEPEDAFDRLLAETGIAALAEEEAMDEAAAERKNASLHDLRRWWMRAAENGADVGTFVQQLQLVASSTEERAKEGCVQLMTVHAAKGLEFDAVYLIGLNEGLFPHANALEEGRLPEERRLMYVAITRARFHLTISFCEKRRGETLAPSRFLAELDGDGVQWVDEGHEAEAAQEEALLHIAALRKRLGIEP